MAIIKNTAAICVLTGQGLETILKVGGSQSWVLDPKRAKKYPYVVCVQNVPDLGDWGNASAEHHTAFVVGKLIEIVPTTDKGASEGRWLLRFSEYAQIRLVDAWQGFRNPVRYTDLVEMNIDVNALQFHPMPEIKIFPINDVKVTGLSLSQAKAGLALTFGVDPTGIEITIRG